MQSAILFFIVVDDMLLYDVSCCSDLCTYMLDIPLTMSTKEDETLHDI